MTIQELQNKIIELKKEKDVCLLVHAYQNHEILEVADYVGDSYGLSLKAKDAPQKNVVMCGVRFMAETVKVLSPEKRVFIANENALCPMANQMDKEQVEALREQYPDYTIVAYINTTSELKTAVDVCVTSSSAVEIIKNIKNDKILFIPDCNLGSWVQKQIPEKEFKFFHGGCPTHLRITKKDIERAKEIHPNAEILVHPECLEEVTNEADYAGSTTGIMNYAKKSDKKEFVIGTENSIVHHLQYECPDKMFYSLSKECVCPNMRATTLMDVYNTIKGVGGKEIFIDDEVRTKAKNCIDKMIELGG
ncbi:quinolinate synthase NadA [Lachnobacterium bovis]|jgi:quinolinate synthase|uniref:Quinolinate synthase n=1 Tax=Lachnobacterium bovis DSM 14045 TaxID=1122142 RepID=A0A1H3LDY0_9FIRM|nr:quinolinate synthase NadA [Lachnobacterium bovis]SDY62613.1 quinolinate synthetase [Lachnobacterium bovis DSM 14045]